MKRLSVFLLATAGLLVTVTAAFAVTSWNRNIDWNVSPVAEFEMFQDAALTIPFPSGSSVDIGDPGTGSYSETYYFNNVGNVDIKITGEIDMSGSESTADVSWIPGSQIIVLLDSNGSITLTLENFTVGSGGCTVTFSCVEAP